MATLPDEHRCVGSEASHEVADRVRKALQQISSEGTVQCAEALEIARQLRVTPECVGKELEEQGLKVRKCSLGCFE